MGQRTYEQQKDRPRLIGSPADSGNLDVISAVNTEPGALQQDTVTISGYVALKPLTWTVDGVAFGYTMTVADANEDGVAASITAQLNTEPLFSGKYHATASAAVITITARFAGVGWTIVATGTWAANFTVANVTANASASAIPFGRLVVDDAQVSGKPDRQAKLAAATNLSAKVLYATPVQESSVIYSIGVKVKGHTYMATITSDGTATVKEIVEALTPILNADLPTQTVVVTEDDAKMIFTAELAGLDFELVVGSGGSTGVWTIAETTVTKATDVNTAALGVALRVENVEINDATNPGYIANSAMSVLRNGRVVVATERSITIGNHVYVRLADTGVTGNPIGSFSDTAGTDLVKLDPTRFRWAQNLSSTRAILQVACD